jgi:hypothetical protein
VSLLARYWSIVGAVGLLQLFVAPPDVHAQSAPPPKPETAGVIQGTLYDSLLTKGPLPGATIYLVGSNFTATTDRRGHFEILDVPAGEHTLTFSHRAFDAAGVQTPQLTVRVPAANKVRINVATPSGLSVIKATCGGTPLAEKTGLLLGVVRDVDTGGPLPDARVSSRWFELTIEKNGPRYETLETAATTDQGGVFRLCGVPADIPVMVRASLGGQQSGRVEVYFSGADVAFRDFAVSLRDSAARIVADSLVEGVADSATVAIAQGSAFVRGIVRDQNGRPLPNVSLSLLDRYQRAVTDSSGRFALRGVPAGSQTVELRAIGFAPARRVMVLRSDTPADTVFILDRAAQTLAAVHVLANRSGSRSFGGFEDRRRRGLGFFMEADEIVRKSGIYLGDVLRFAPGLMATYTQKGRVFTMRAGYTGKRCSPAYFLDGIRWYALDPDSNPILEMEHFLAIRDVAAVEVYSGGAETPIQFDSGTGCGVVLFWTKR